MPVRQFSTKHFNLCITFCLNLNHTLELNHSTLSVVHRLPQKGPGFQANRNNYKIPFDGILLEAPKLT